MIESSLNDPFNEPLIFVCKRISLIVERVFASLSELLNNFLHGDFLQDMKEIEREESERLERTTVQSAECVSTISTFLWAQQEHVVLK